MATKTLEQPRVTPSRVSGYGSPLVFEELSLPPIDLGMLRGVDKRDESSSARFFYGSGRISYAGQLYKAMVDQVVRMGMQRISFSEMSKMLTGSDRYRFHAPNGGLPFSNSMAWARSGDKERQVYGVALKHPHGYLDAMTCQPVISFNPGRRWWWQPSKPNLRFGPLSALAIPVPDGVQLRAQHLDKMGVFSGINVLAPEVAFTDAKTVVDPIAVATIYRPFGDPADTDQMTHFFIAKWPD